LPTMGNPSLSKPEAVQQRGERPGRRECDQRRQLQAVIEQGHRVAVAEPASVRPESRRGRRARTRAAPGSLRSSAARSVRSWTLRGVITTSCQGSPQRPNCLRGSAGIRATQGRR
jgi:hypothetical protein